MNRNIVLSKTHMTGHPRGTCQSKAACLPRRARDCLGPTTRCRRRFCMFCALSCKSPSERCLNTHVLLPVANDMSTALISAKSRSIWSHHSKSRATAAASMPSLASKFTLTGKRILQDVSRVRECRCDRVYLSFTLCMHTRSGECESFNAGRLPP